jgi:hypothetical protein
MSERELLEQARGGDEDAVGRLVELDRSVLYAHTYRMLGSAADAEDAIQDSLLGALARVVAVRGPKLVSVVALSHRDQRLAEDHRAATEAGAADRLRSAGRGPTTRSASCLSSRSGSGRSPTTRSASTAGSPRWRLATSFARASTGLVAVAEACRVAVGRARLVGPHRRGGLPLVPEIDAPATLGSARTTSAREHRAARGTRGARDCAAGAVAARAAYDDRAADPPLRACAHLRWRPAAWRRVAASRAGVLAGVTPGAAVSTYGV